MSISIHPGTARRCRDRSRCAFTLVELMVVMGIIVLLITILITVVSGARETARATSTSATMTALTQGVVRFREDTGYLPPLLDESRAIMDPPPLDDGNVFERLQGWYSITSPAEYLLGYGHHGEDGFGWAPDSDFAETYNGEFGPDEIVRLGIRHPGFDGVWSSSLAQEGKGSLAGRLERFQANKVKDDGPVLGPYLELPSKGVIGALAWVHDEDDGSGFQDAGHEGIGEWDPDGIDPVSGQPQVYFPGEEGYDKHAPKVICDAWGSPIRYYRLNYPSGALSRVYPATNDPFCPRLSQYIALRPWEFEPGTATDYYVPSDAVLWGDFNSTLDGEDTRGDSSTSYDLQAAEFAFMSAGPDRRINNWQRNDFPGIGGNNGTQFNDDWHYRWGSIPGSNPDHPVPETEEVNKDNIVETGS